MKKKIIFCLTAMLFTCGLLLSAREPSHHSTHSDPGVALPAWISDQGYWVLETHRHQRRQSQVHFYDNNNRLIASTTIVNRRLNTHRRKVKMELKCMLEASILAWKNQQQQTDVAQQP